MRAGPRNHKLNRERAIEEILVEDLAPLLLKGPIRSSSQRSPFDGMAWTLRNLINIDARQEEEPFKEKSRGGLISCYRKEANLQQSKGDRRSSGFIRHLKKAQDSDP